MGDGVCVWGEGGGGREDAGGWVGVWCADSGVVEYPDAVRVTEGRASIEVVEGRLYKLGEHDGESYVGGIVWLDVSSV